MSILVAVAWADIIACHALYALKIAVPLALILWVVMKCHGR